jgi:hypothetical protein
MPLVAVVKNITGKNYDTILGCKNEKGRAGRDRGPTKLTEICNVYLNT